MEKGCFSELINKSNDDIERHIIDALKSAVNDSSIVTDEGKYILNHEINDVAEPLAMMMYDDYCIAVGGKTFNGDELPASVDFFTDPTKAKQANAWRIAAVTAINYLK